ncbi:hypothetical protein ACHAXT_008641 [Thalassiosira profunda]
MNVRGTDDHELDRVPARSRFSAPPSASFDFGANDNYRASAKKSKGGINGRSYESDEEDELGLSSKKELRSLSKRTSSGLNEAEKLARQSSYSSTASKDRPWRSASGGSASENNSRSSSYATAAEGDGSIFDWGSSSSKNNRWSEPDDLAEESRRATSAAVNTMATQYADSMEEEVSFNPSSPMGGSRGTGYGGDEMAGLTENGNSLPPAMDKRKSDTDYVKSRLSKLVPKWNDNSVSEHDRVRDEALKMLEIADSSLSMSPLNSAPSSPRTPRNSAAGLFRTAGGGLAMRGLHDDEVEKISISGSKRRDTAGISGIDNFKERTPSKSRWNGTFTIGSNDEDDLQKGNSNGNPVSPNEDTPSMWSSRYSVERQLMAITGGLDSKQLLSKMDVLHARREKTKSARGLYRASGYAMDGSHEEYNDYSKGSSTGVGLGGIWMWIRGTLWGDVEALNSDGTTQSLVRREKALRRRRMCRFATLFVMALAITAGVVGHWGTQQMKSSDVNFYVLADEPYDWSNTEQVTRELENLPKDAEFVVHLGNSNGDEQSMCQEYGFTRAAAVFKESPVPVLVLPAGLDWAACGSEKAALESLHFWEINLGQLEKNWKHPLDVEYSEDVVGNFAFLHKGVLFVGVSIIDVETKPDELTARLEQNVMWTKAQLTGHEANEYHAVVIFGHAPPSSDQGEYFWPITEQVKDLGKPVLYLHANADGSFERYTPFSEAENFGAVQLEKQGLEAPMRVKVKGKKGKEGDDLFMFERREPTEKRIQA